MIEQHKFGFDLPIWKILYDTNLITNIGCLLAVETRDKEQVSWQVIDIDSNKTVWQNRPQETTWWTTMSAFDGLKLTLSCYSGTSEPTPAKLLFLDTLTGQIVEPNGLSETPAHTIINNTEPQWKNLTAYQQLDVYYVDMAQFIEQIVGKNVEHTIFYGEIATNIVLIYYICSSETSALSPFLLVVSSQKVVLLHKPIEGSSDNTFSELCIYNQSQLIYLSGLNELTTLKFI